MRTVITLGLVFMCVFGATRLWANSLPVTSVAAVATESYEYQVAVPPVLPDLSAYLVMDEETGEVLLEYQADELLPIASVAKLLVAGAALRLPILSATTTITAGDVATAEAFGRLQEGEVYSLYELLFPYLLESSNDAGASLARAWGGEIKESVDGLLTMTDTTEAVVLDDYTGLSSETQASARALATLARELVMTTSELFDITTLPRYVGPTATLVNNSPVWERLDYQGGKHGYTPEAGKTLLARINTPFPDGERTLIYVILGGTSHRDDLANLVSITKSAVTRIPQTATTSAILPTSHNEQNHD